MSYLLSNVEATLEQRFKFDFVASALLKSCFMVVRSCNLNAKLSQICVFPGWDTTFKSNCSLVFYRITDLKNFAKFIGKHLWWKSFPLQIYWKTLLPKTNITQIDGISEFSSTLKIKYNFIASVCCYFGPIFFIGSIFIVLIKLAFIKACTGTITKKPFTGILQKFCSEIFQKFAGKSLRWTSFLVEHE